MYSSSDDNEKFHYLLLTFVKIEKAQKQKPSGKDDTIPMDKSILKDDVGGELP